MVGSSVKRLSRRPSFESLGSATSCKDEARALSREGSFASSGSLKRSASELEMDDDKAPGQSVSPEAAEAAAQPTINAALGFVKGIMPLCPQPLPEVVSSFVMPPPKPAPVLSESFKPNYSSKAMKPPGSCTTSGRISTAVCRTTTRCIGSNAFSTSSTSSAAVGFFLLPTATKLCARRGCLFGSRRN